MNTIKKLVLALVAMVCVSTVAVAQQMPPIPVDPNVRIGKLDNGLTYYISHNEYPKGQAEFYIAQKVGSINEEESQRGLAHFLEHMCFNGTKSFPGNNLIKWLETVGVKFGYNLNAYTAVDRTVYNISAVPTDRVSVQDSCLLILHDWADDLLLADDEIDSERKVIHEEWRSRMVGQMRILERQLPTIYAGDRYGERLPIGLMSVVDNFPYKELRDYYEKWYRPDLQGILVVGDIDVDRTEAKIKELFSDIKMPANPAPRVYFPVKDTEGTIYAIDTDKEQTNSMLQIMFKQEATQDSDKLNLDYMVQCYAVNMMERMLNERYSDLVNKGQVPFAYAGVGYGNFLLSKTKDALTLTALDKGSNILPVVESSYRELLRAVRGGFTVSEYERARKEYLSQLEKAYNNRKQTTSNSLVEGYVENFLDNEPIPGIENEYQIMNMVAGQIPVEAINQILPQIVTDNNRVVFIALPEKDGVPVPTKEQVAEVMAKVDAENIEPYKEEVKSEPLISALPKAGKVVKDVKNTEFDCQEWTLSNGIKVLVKPTTFADNEIKFDAEAKGGSSIYPDADAANLRVLQVAVGQLSLGTYNSSDLTKYLAGKQAGVGLGISSYDRELSGSTTPQDLETLMELIYMHFTAPGLDAEEFKSMTTSYAGILEHQVGTPQYEFGKFINESLFKSPKAHSISAEDFKMAGRERIVSIIKEQLANPAEFTMAFVGNIDVPTLKALVEKYIACLPTKKVKQQKIKLGALSVTPGEHTYTSSLKMETPQVYGAVMVAANVNYTLKNKQLSQIVSQILNTRLTEEVREKEGATYGVNVGGDLRRISDDNYKLQVVFPMKPEKREIALGIVKREINDMASSISDEELNKVKEFMAKSYKENREKNSYWSAGMVAPVLNGVNTINGAIETLNTITPADVKAFMKEVNKQGNYSVVILNPAE